MQASFLLKAFVLVTSYFLSLATAAITLPSHSACYQYNLFVHFRMLFPSQESKYPRPIHESFVQQTNRRRIAAPWTTPMGWKNSFLPLRLSLEPTNFQREQCEVKHNVRGTYPPTEAVPVSRVAFASHCGTL